MSDVKTYQMPQSDQEQRKKRSPNFYIECKEIGMLDKDVASRMGISPANLSILKGRWDFVGKSLEQMKAKLKQETKKSYIKNKGTMKDDIKEDVEKAQEEKEAAAPVQPKEQEDPHADYEKYMKELKQKLNDETGAKTALEDKVKQLEEDNQEDKEKRNYWEREYKRADAARERWKSEHVSLKGELDRLQADQQPKQTVSELNEKIGDLKEWIQSLEQENMRLENEKENYKQSFKVVSDQLGESKQRSYHLFELVKMG
ncbi:hypothetical protein MUO14_24015 [Halobacillus shinanisalinarum]|uniref:Uncharacterized protein n=1 Tax=Halobacillus shinanisalinarum TaxID=2932258 RepID=A0ABY4GZ61_9BACI|nr:hypothetical protein [Halobacillus shinanisalinarum]UOQ93398.1 hypothetical protein MUO14_24015 [Halobacillus shinanisalinarum]